VNHIKLKDLRGKSLVLESAPEVIQRFPHGAIDQTYVSPMGSIDLEVVDRSPDVAGARMRRVGRGNALGELQFVLSSSDAAICAGSDLDGDVTRRLELLFASTDA